MPRYLAAPIALLCVGTLAQAAEDPAPRAFGTAQREAAPRGFGVPEPAAAAGGGASGAESADRRDREYARGLLQKYDTSGDRVLQEEEWRLISGTPEKADANADGRITYDELVARVSAKSRERDTPAPPSGDRRSYRLLTPADRLPEGLPDWFAERDLDRDGQVAMHEYSRRWSPSSVRLFADLDRNDDGLVTPKEALAAGR